MKFQIAKYKNFQELHNDELEKTINFLRNGDFKSADSKKLSNSNYFRAKIDSKARLIFQFGYINNISYIFLLEVLLNHEYKESQFLKGKKVLEEDFVFDKEHIEDSLVQDKLFHYSDQFIVFNKTQESLLYTHPPLIIVGSAGSGKTSVTIEKLRILKGKILYISLSQELVNSAKSICGDYENIEFFSFEQFINNIEKQEGKVIDFYIFKKWAYNNKIKEIEKYFEEFKGVLTAEQGSAYIDLDSYLQLGKNQSLFTPEKREDVYKKFTQYLQFLKKNNIYDNNIAIYSLFEKTKEIYDFIVIDEIQDFTNKEIALILNSLKNKQNFIFSGDSNQIIYSNFFSWSHLKTMLYKNQTIDAPITILQENYRNSKNITKVANTLLKIKQLQFGSIDKESNYLIETKSEIQGDVHFFQATPKNIKEINQETENSTKVAVIVFDEITKKEIKKDFKTALVYTVQEVKGLEYEEVILVNFVSNYRQAFNEITKGIQQDNLLADLKYNRSGKKETESRLESYKIYINSLYVALTRGIKKLYILEKNNHKVFELLNIVQEKKNKKIMVEQSSTKEWEEEAKRLEKLGKTEQVEEIRSKKLKLTPKETEVVNNIDITTLKQDALDPKIFNKKAKDALFKVAKEKDQQDLIEKLVELKYAPARKYLETLHNTAPLIVQKKKNEKVYWHAQNNNIKQLKKLISNNTNLNYQAPDGSSSIMLAIEMNHIEIAKLLILNGANVNIAKNDGGTALMQAAIVNSIEIAQLLLEYGADIELQNEAGITALLFASNYQNIDMFKLLLQHGANPNIQDKLGLTSLMDVSDIENIEIAKLLFKENVDPNLQSNKKGTALMFAAQSGHKEIAQLLLKNDADINTQNDEGSTALMLAVKNKQVEVVKLLLEYGADITIKNIHEASAVTLAKNNDEILSLLQD